MTAGKSNEHGKSEAPPRGVKTMAWLRWGLVAVMAAVAAISVAYSCGLVAASGPSAGDAQYYCPMHPQVVQEYPGECPICSMRLVLKQREGGGSTKSSEPKATEHDGHRDEPSGAFYCPMHPAETGTSADARCAVCGMKLEPRPDAGVSGVPGLAPLELAPDRVQLIGVRTAPARLEDLTPELRTVGFVSADESRVARVHARFSGWVERLPVSETGQKVRPGQVLAAIYNLELLPMQQEFLSARRSAGGALVQPDHGPAPQNLAISFERDARGRLELFGMSPAEIRRVARSGQPLRVLSVSAPIGGYVIKKNIASGTYIQPGTELFEIADLANVWVLADVYESEIARVAEGQTAEVTVEAFPGQRFGGKVAFIYPTLNGETRTLRLRVELDNKDLKLRPGMYADVALRLSEARGVVIPFEALVDTGQHQYVFLAGPGGRFEPRRVRPGARSGDKLQILEGLAPGEIVVTTANFMIDSESRLRAAIEGAPAVVTPGAEPALPGSTCDTELDKAKFPGKYEQCRQCELVHRGMGTMEEDCKKAIPKPWR
jgi:Cu(I)/Ag(I) efflux system membrane fusion protein